MLEVKNLTFKVNENGIERSIVKNISFHVDDGEMLVITGPNGGGKSTLAKVLMGIEEADEGQIVLDGEDITAMISTTGRMQGLVLHSSSLRDSRA